MVSSSSLKVDCGLDVLDADLANMSGVDFWVAFWILIPGTELMNAYVECLARPAWPYQI